MVQIRSYQEKIEWLKDKNFTLAVAHAFSVVFRAAVGPPMISGTFRYS